MKKTKHVKAPVVVAEDSDDDNSNEIEEMDVDSDEQIALQN